MLWQQFIKEKEREKKRINIQVSKKNQTKQKHCFLIEKKMNLGTETEKIVVNFRITTIG